MLATKHLCDSSFQEAYLHPELQWTPQKICESVLLKVSTAVQYVLWYLIDAALLQSYRHK